MFKKVRTRIAPSPTGIMHVGTARTAIYCWAVARHFGGEFFLRIEDTDRERSTEEAVKAIFEGLDWLKIDYDNKDNVVYQMSRLDKYQAAAKELLDKGLAYYCYATPEELQELRDQHKGYDGRWRPENCVGKTPPPGVKPVIRFRNPDDGVVAWNDAVLGPTAVNNSELDDIVIMRADGIPTYNFAVVIDDSDMEISHVIRGNDHVTNTPKQINIYKALGKPIPTFAHIPLIHGEDGKKLSKRNGAVGVMEYEKMGFVPDALFNYLARLGWAHGDAEKFTRDQLATWFKLSDCSHSKAQLNMKKLTWLNHEYIKEMDDAALAALMKPKLLENGADLSKPADLEKVAGLLKERCDTINKMVDEAMIFYTDHSVDPTHITDKVKESDIPASQRAIKQFYEKAKDIDWTKENINNLIHSVMEEDGIKMATIAIPLRVLTTGATHTPSIDATLELIGKDTVLAKLEKGLEIWKAASAQ